MTRDPDERRLSELRAPRRAHYFDGQLLTAADFAREQDYCRSRERLLNRLALGYGVVSGLEVSPEDSGVSVSPGLAIDGWGA